MHITETKIGLDLLRLFVISAPEPLTCFLLISWVHKKDSLILFPHMKSQ